MRIGVLSNPKSQRNRQGLDAVQDVIRAHPEVMHRELTAFEKLETILAEMLAARLDLIAVNGGDGTVQAVLTALARRADGLNDPACPLLAVMAGGMTNVIARDVGIAGPPARALQRLLAHAGRPETLERRVRPLIGLYLGPDEPPVYGMFFGAAAFYQAVTMAQNNIRPTGFAGSLASAVSLSMILIRLLVNRPGADNPLYRGASMALELDGVRRPEQSYLLVIATTLERLILGLMPFWRNEGRAIRLTTVAFPPRRLALALLPVLRGRPRPWMQDAGYHSEGADRVTLCTDSPLVLDGEIFHPAAGVPITLTSDRRACFARC